ncbi:MAG: lyase family protein [Pseudomonadota bacterium]
MTGHSSLLTSAIFGHSGLKSRFEDDALIAAMVQVEVTLARVQAELGLIPVEAAQAIADLPKAHAVSSSALVAGVADAGVPVPALVASLRQSLSEDAADWLHFGATSQDIIDTALCLCYQAALQDLEAGLATVIDTLESLSRAHAETLMIGRTRGQLATPITFGLRAAQWAQPLISRELDLPGLRESALRVQLGGAAGSQMVLGEMGPEVSRLLAEQLGLAAASPWHTDRSGIRKLAQWLSDMIMSMAKIGADVALMARGEIAEVSLANGGGSSTMPHKSNPVIAEALQSLTAVAAATNAGLASAAVHTEERDGANWPVEWALMPPLFEAAGAAISHAQKLLGGLEVRADAMAARLAATPEVKAEAAVFALARRVGRSEASRLVTIALASDQPLRQALPEIPDLSWDEALSDRAFCAPAAVVAAEIFAKRQPSSDHD